MTRPAIAVAVRLLCGAAAVFVFVALVVRGVITRTWPATPVDISLRWTSGIADEDRTALERRLGLTAGERREGTTWRYQLTDASTANIAALVRHPQVEDTGGLDRSRNRPEPAQDRARRIQVFALAMGALASFLFLIAAMLRGDTPGVAMPAGSRVATAGVAAAAGLASLVIAAWSGASAWSVLAAMAVVYACGYIAGSLVVERAEGFALAVMRTIAGLILTAMSLLLSLELRLPWFIGPAVVLVAALVLRGAGAVWWPAWTPRVRADGVVAAVVVVVMLLPVAITFVYMSPGPFPPVIYNVDTAYSLEKTHAIVAANAFPPPSLGNLGVTRTYHYGVQAIAALIARTTGLLPHHALFLIVLPLMTAGLAAAAASAAKYLSPDVPRAFTVPLLLMSVPSLSRSLWAAYGPTLWSAITTMPRTVEGWTGDVAQWGFLSNESQNLGGDFLILATIAGMAALPVWGWRLPAFFIGCAVLIKTPVGIALVAGVTLAEAARMLIERRLQPSRMALAAAGIFAATAVPFFLLSFDSAFRVDVYPLYHLRDVVAPAGFGGITADLLWLALPALIVLPARAAGEAHRSLPFVMMALAPVIVTNVTTLQHTGGGGEGIGDDWQQVLHAVPFLAHAAVLSVVGARWVRLGKARRAAVLLAIAVALAPAVAAAARYSARLLDDPVSGHEFVDNAAMAEALAAIPKEGSLIVTNDLRYPADGFARDDRQMQIPALFGHQGFVLNFSYEQIEARRPIQRLLQQPAWDEAIRDAARQYGWTHFVVRKAAVHPRPVPLTLVFENGEYAVHRF